jgi:drug/metabolite transporter (DMT)-like permease
MKMLSQENQGSLYAILSGLLYGLVGYFGLSLMDTNLSISNMQFWRFLVSALFIGIIFAKRISVSKESGLAIVNTFCFGGLFYSIAAGVYFIGSQYIGSGPSMVIFFTYPVFVMLLNWMLYKRKISKMYYFAVILIVLGMTQLVELKEFKADLLGIGLALLSGISYAMYIICSKNIKISPIMSTIMVSLGCAFSCLIYALWDNSFVFPSTQEQWLLILGFGIVTTGIPMLLFLEGLKKISSEKASILSVTEPVFVVIFGIVLLEEVINLPKIVGIITILAGALITLMNKKSKLFSTFKKYSWRTSN